MLRVRAALLAVPFGRPHMKGALAWAAIAVLVVGACRVTLPGAAQSPGQFAQKPVPWFSCDDGFQCASLDVPLDYSNPGGRQISLALIRKPATEPSRRIGSLLINPGGPGESGIDSLRYSSDDFSALNTKLDLVSWDPRGIGRSTNVDCLSGPELDAFFALDPVLDDPKEKETYIQAQKDFDSACWRRHRDILPFMDSMSTAQDMERIRAAVGDSKLTYIGFSYGTYIGQWYAHLYPSHVRAMVLDGVVLADTRTPSPFDLVGLAEADEESLRPYLAGCPARSTCPYPASANIEVSIERAMAGLDAKPVAVGTRQLTRGLGLTALFNLIYDPSSAPDLDRALAALEKGDGSLMLQLADYFDERNDDGTYASAVNGGQDATSCIDGPDATANISDYDQAGPALTRASPLFGPMIQYAYLRCAFWPVDARGYDRPSIKGAPPILLIGATGDPVTPYEAAMQANTDIPRSVLLTREGSGHTSYGYTECIDAAANNYLLYLVLPPAHTTCPG